MVVDLHEKVECPSQQGVENVSDVDTATSTPREMKDLHPDMELVENVIRSLGSKGIVGNEHWLRMLAFALPPQMEAAFGGDDPANQLLRSLVEAAQREHGMFIDPQDNWFTRNVKRFGGGFDMRKLMSEPGLLATKFDRLSNKYHEWHVGNSSRVEFWLTSCACKYASEYGGPEIRILDVACGIGLPVHQLRLCGYKGRALGTDISHGMIECTKIRGAHDDHLVANTNEGLPSVSSASIDLVLCTGALELLDQAAVLATFARILKGGGRAWLSFQLELPEECEARQHPTAHQNIKGLTRQEIEEKLLDADLEIEDAERCDNAFYTPSPQQDGSLLPVPYLFVVARKPH